MESFIEFLNFKERLSGRRLKVVLYSAVFGLLMALLCSGKPYLNLALKAIVVSPDEQYIACFEPSAEYRIHCFHADGSMAFTYNIPVDISAGGHCALWFEDDVLCALFYRTDKIVYFTLSGSILNIADGTEEESPPEFPSFFRRGHQYVFDGNEIDIVYDEGSFLGYWLFGAERSLTITPQNGETKVVYAWTATEGITN